MRRSQPRSRVDVNHVRRSLFDLLGLLGLLGVGGSARSDRSAARLAALPAAGPLNPIETMVLGKLFYFTEETTLAAQFEVFMKLAGPYWMSCVTKNDTIPILEPDHDRTYLDRRA
jgi:hypothetical protein